MLAGLHHKGDNQNAIHRLRTQWFPASCEHLRGRDKTAGSTRPRTCADAYVTCARNIRSRELTWASLRGEEAGWPRAKKATKAEMLTFMMATRKSARVASDYLDCQMIFGEGKGEMRRKRHFRSPLSNGHMQIVENPGQQRRRPWQSMSFQGSAT